MPPSVAVEPISKFGLLLQFAPGSSDVGDIGGKARWFAEMDTVSTERLT